MSAFELYIAQPRPTRNRSTGQFLKGHTPHNKGQEDWFSSLPKRSQKRMAKGWKNLQKHRPTTRPDNAGRCRKKCVVVTDDGKFKIFDYIGQAGEWVGGSRENVRRCCQCNEAQHINKKTGQVNTDHRYKGYRFYYYDNAQWWDKI